MCGIAGFVGGDWPTSEGAIRVLEEMNGALRHRGPDDCGIWIDSDARVGFAHNRLTILDLSSTGQQPMQSHSGRYVISYNGEIYNHLGLRTSVPDDTRWRGTSDTESLLAAIEQFGIRGAIERTCGMFAFALWDRENRSLTLVRDRVGEKPLYYGVLSGARPILLFASELKGIARHPSFRGEINRDALSLLLRFGYVPEPLSIYRGIQKLPPGSLLTFTGDSPDPKIERYWSALEVAEAGVSNRLPGDEDDVVDQLETLLERVISREMLADVPVGAFLSGGIDSSTIVALMQKLSSRPVKTFTIGFDEKKYNEAENAKAVAIHLGTDHCELYVTSEEARAVIPRLPKIYDEPFADSSQIPTYLISALARKDVKVALSGDGGDELFGGYRRHVATAEIWDRISWAPRQLRALFGSTLLAVPISAWSAIGTAGRALVPKWVKAAELPETIQRGAPLLAANSVADLYEGIVSQWNDPDFAVIGSKDRKAGPAAFPYVPGISATEQFMAVDLVRYLPDDILVKVDRAAMAVSLETRMPFLDHQLIEFAWRLPLRFKIRDSETKVVLRRLLERYVPEALVNRPKMGFAAPIGEWLRGPLREWADALLDSRRLREQGYFRAEVVEQLWHDHLHCVADEKRRLWPVLMFQSWLLEQPSSLTSNLGAQ